MKNILLSLFFLLSCGDDPFSKVKSENVEMAVVRDNTSSKIPVMTFDKKVHDFGTIQNGTPVETVFSYTNTGDSPLVITDIKSTCGCTVPRDWSREPLNPGESSQFTVKFDGKGCAICMACSSVLTEMIKGKDLDEVKKFEKDELLSELGLEHLIKTSPVRIKCALLSLKALKYGIYSYFAEKMNDAESAGNLKDEAANLY